MEQRGPPLPVPADADAQVDPVQRLAGEVLPGIGRELGGDVPALALALGFDMPAAAGTSLVVIAINSAAALAARLGGQASLDWPLIAVFTAAALAGVLPGNRVASRVDASRLTTALTVLLIAVAAYSLTRSLSGLA